MVDSVNPVGTTPTTTYNISFEELDANKDGKVDKTDYDMLQGYLTDQDESNDLKVTSDDLDKIFEDVLSGEKTVLEDCPECVAQPPEDGGDADAAITVDNVNAKADALIADTARTEIDPNKATTLEELATMQETLTKQIAEYDAVEKVLLEKIEDLQSKLEGLQDDAERKEREYEENANLADDKANAAKDKADESAQKAAAATEDAATESKKIAAKVLANYKAGEYGDESLQSVLERELGIKPDTSEAEDAASDAAKLSNEVAALASKLTQIAGDIDSIKTAANSNSTDLAATISDRDSVLQLRQADSNKFQEAYNVKENLEKVEEPVPETKTGSGGCDPMSFVKDNIKYDFIQDRDNDNIFDDATEFLGAQDGWAEMQAYDTNQDGKIEGDELKEMKIVGVDQTTGKYTFSTADEVGVTSIDLSTYKEAGTTKNTGDTLDGTFKVNIGGQEVDAEQTTDTQLNLTNKYGSLFGKDIKDYGETFETNPFTSTFQANVDAAKLANEADAAADEADGAVDGVEDPTTPEVDGENTNPPATDGENNEDPNKKDDEEK